MVKTSETNDAHTKNTTIHFVDRVTNPMTGEAMNRGERLHFGLVMILSTQGITLMASPSTNYNAEVKIGLRRSNITHCVTISSKNNPMPK
jgi:hypothetical protein